VISTAIPAATLVAEGSHDELRCTSILYRQLASPSDEPSGAADRRFAG
jgi:hypothetical protein